MEAVSGPAVVDIRASGEVTGPGARARSSPLSIFQPARAARRGSSVSVRGPVGIGDFVFCSGIADAELEGLTEESEDSDEGGASVAVVFGRDGKGDFASTGEAFVFTSDLDWLPSDSLLTLFLIGNEMAICPISARSLAPRASLSASPALISLSWARVIVLVGGEMAVKVFLTVTAGACVVAVEAVEEVDATDAVVMGVDDAAGVC